MSLFKKFVGQAFIYGGSFILMRILNYVVFSIYLSREFQDNTEFLAIYKILYGYIGFCIIFLGLRMDTTYFRYIKEFTQKTFGSILSIYSTLLIPLFLLVVLSNKAIGSFIFRKIDLVTLPSEVRGELIVLAAIIIALDVLLILPFSQFRSQEKAAKFSIYKIMQVGLMLLFFVIGLRVWPGLEIDGKANHIELLRLAMYANLFGSSATMLSLLPIFFKSYHGSNNSLIKTMLGYSLPLIIASLSLYLPTQGVSAILELVSKSGNTDLIADIGKYAGIAQFSFLLIFFNQAYNYAAEPFFFEQSDRQDKKTIYADMAYFYSLSCSFLILCILLFQDFIISFIGLEYTKYLFLLPVMLVGTYLYGMYLNFSIWYKITDNTIYATYINGIGALFFCVAAVFFINYYGISSMAWVVTSTFLIICILTILSGRTKFKVPYDFKGMFQWLFIALLAFYFFRFLAERFEFSEFLSFFLKLVIIALFLFAAFWFNRKRITKAFALD